MKGSTISSRHRRNDKIKQHPNAPPQPLMNSLPQAAHQWMEMDNSMFAANHESPDDKHVIKKYNEIKMEEGRLEGVNRLVDAVEAALKSISDKLTEYYCFLNI